MKFFVYYLLLINALGFVFMSVDKYRARKNLWRVPERTLLAFAFLGGSFGVLLGIRLLRHKTRKEKFSVGVPVLFAFHSLLVFFWMFFCK